MSPNDIFLNLPTLVMDSGVEEGRWEVGMYAGMGLIARAFPDTDLQLKKVKKRRC